MIIILEHRIHQDQQDVVMPADSLVVEYVNRTVIQHVILQHADLLVEHQRDHAHLIVHRIVVERIVLRNVQMHVHHIVQLVLIIADSTAVHVQVNVQLSAVKHVIFTVLRIVSINA